MDDPTADATLEAAWDVGVRYFDTAPWYGLGMSEHRVGRFLRTKPRSSFVLSTKVGRVITRPPAPMDFRPDVFWSNALPFEWHFDYTRDAILRSFEDSLQRLGLNRVDLLWVHDVERGAHGGGDGVKERLDELDRGGGFAALSELRRSGAVQGIGIALNEDEAVPALVERFDVDSILLAGPYTLLEQGALEWTLPMCQARRIGVVVGKVFHSGVLATGLTRLAQFASDVPASPGYEGPPAGLVDRVSVLAEVYGRFGVELGTAAMRFPLGHPAVGSVIPGAALPNEVRQNAERFVRRVPAALWRELQGAGLIRPDAPFPPEM